MCKCLYILEAINTNSQEINRSSIKQLLISLQIAIGVALITNKVCHESLPKELQVMLYYLLIS